MRIWRGRSNTIFTDARYILERASARETTARVAVGALAKAFLGEFGIRVLSHVIGVGEARLDRAAAWEELVELSKRDEVLLGCVDAGGGAAHESRGRSGVSHGRHGGRRV